MTDPTTGPLGLFGGTFDPIHLGHLRLAEEAREALALAQVCFIPAGRPPHRGVPGSTPEHRLAMVRLAIAGNPAFSLDDAEVCAPRPSYTVDTLLRLRQTLGPARPLVLMLGADAFAGLPTWHRWEQIFSLAHVAVANRPGHAPHGRRWPDALSDALDTACRDRIHRNPDVLRHTPAGAVVPFDMTPLAISATLVRDLIAHGQSARYLLADSVCDYIAGHHLYPPEPATD